MASVALPVPDPAVKLAFERLIVDALYIWQQAKEREQERASPLH